MVVRRPAFVCVLLGWLFAVAPAAQGQRVWGPPAQFTPSGVQAEGIRAAVAPSGEVIAAWAESRGMTARLTVR